LVPVVAPSIPGLDGLVSDAGVANELAYSLQVPEDTRKAFRGETAGIQDAEGAVGRLERAVRGELPAGTTAESV
jgi:hypothetical protein